MEQVTAFFSDDLGRIKRGILVGMIDGRPLWFNITQGDKADVIDTDPKSPSRYELICLEGEVTNPVVILRVLSRTIDYMGWSLKDELVQWVNLAKRKGIKWSHEPLSIHFTATYRYDKNNKLRIVISIEEDACLPEFFTDIESKCKLSDAFDRMKELVEVLEEEAEIPVSFIKLSINDELKKQMTEEEKQFFNEIDNDVII